MRPLLIDEDFKTNMTNLVAYAEKNPFTMDDLLDIKNNAMKAAGDMDHYTVLNPMGYKIVFSIEQQVKADVRHLSISVFTPGELPSVVAVSTIMKMIGFENPVRECMVRMENIGPGHEAVNIWELISGTER